MNKKVLKTGQIIIACIFVFIAYQILLLVIIPEEERTETYKIKDIGLQFDYYTYMGYFGGRFYDNGNWYVSKKNGPTVIAYSRLSEEQVKNTKCPDIIEIDNKGDHEDVCENIKVREGFKCEIENKAYTSIEGDISVCKKVKFGDVEAVHVLSFDRDDLLMYSENGKETCISDRAHRYLYFSFGNNEKISDLLINGDYTKYGYYAKLSSSCPGKEERLVEIENIAKEYFEIVENGTGHPINEDFDLAYKTLKFRK